MNLENYAKQYDAKLSVIENCINLFKMANKEKTLEHVIEVSKTGVEIAKNYGLDKEKVEIACYLHDISAIISVDDYVNLCENNNVEVLAEERKVPIVLHQKVSKLIAEKIFRITDKEILNSIESHTTLRDNPCDIDMVVFIADKLSWDKEGIPPYFETVSEAIKDSLERACLENIDYRLSNNMIAIPHPMLIEAKDYLEKRLNKNFK